MTLHDFKQQWLSPAECIVAHTSGSTGEPKKILLPKADMITSALATNSFFGLTERDTFVCPLSCSYIAGKMMAVRAWTAGTEPVMLEPSSHFHFDGTASLLAVVPAQTEHILRNPDMACRIKNLIIGGAPLDAVQRKRLVKSGINAYESYGMTETCSHVALRHVADEWFQAMPNVSFETDSRGCLVINLPNYTVGRIVTNDLVELRDKHRFVWLGRADNIINSGGIKIVPEVLERRIREALNPPFDFAIAPMPHPRWGSIAVIAAEVPVVTVQALAPMLREVCDTYIRPFGAVSLPSLPRTSNGKIDRRALAEAVSGDDMAYSAL